MEQRPEQGGPEISKEEQARMAVDSFVARTHTVFSEQEPGHTQWEDLLDRLFGREELIQITKDEGYKGVPGIRERLEAAYKTGGSLRLEVTFMEQALMHTRLRHMAGLSRTAFQRIIDHE